jgi:hypothetical protein
MQSLAVLVEMPRYLAVSAGVTAAVASQASRLSGRRCTSFKVEGTGLVGLTLTLTELGVLPYKGPEVAMSVGSDQPFPHLLLAFCMFPPLMLIVSRFFSAYCTI